MMWISISIFPISSDAMQADLQKFSVIAGAVRPPRQSVLSPYLRCHCEAACPRRTIRTGLSAYRYCPSRHPVSSLLCHCEASAHTGRGNPFSPHISTVIARAALPPVGIRPPLGLRIPTVIPLALHSLGMTEKESAFPIPLSLRSQCAHWLWQSVSPIA